jgi:D-alanine-D-alanine ligase
MKVGMTFDLKDAYLNRGFTPEDAAEFDSETTVGAIENIMKSRGQEVDRIGSVDRLVARLAAGEHWDLVFNIAEGVRGMGREAQIPALLDAWNIPYTFSGPDILALTLNKAWTHSVVRSHGVSTADFAVVREPGDVYNLDLPFPLFVKPVAEGTSKGIGPRSLVTSGPDLKCVCEELLERFRQPALVETYLPGREFTVGILGDGDNARSIGVMEVTSTGSGDGSAYTYANKMNWRQNVAYALVEDETSREVRDLALKAWKALGCLDAGRVDVRLDNQGKPRFMEVNPLPGLDPSCSDLPILHGLGGGKFEDLVGAILDSAMLRAAKNDRSSRSVVL